MCVLRSLICSMHVVHICVFLSIGVFASFFFLFFFQSLKLLHRIYVYEITLHHFVFQHQHQHQKQFFSIFVQIYCTKWKYRGKSVELRTKYVKPIRLIENVCTSILGVHEYHLLKMERVRGIRYPNYDFETSARCRKCLYAISGDRSHHCLFICTCFAEEKYW